MEEIYLSDNQMRGSLQDSFAGMRLKTLDLSTNRFTGPIPVSLGMLNSRANVYLEFNAFEGSVPTEICDAVFRPILSADCLEDIVTAPGNVTIVIPPTNECACCNQCCNPVTRVCDGNGDNGGGFYEVEICPGLEVSFKEGRLVPR